MQKTSKVLIGLISFICLISFGSTANAKNIKQHSSFMGSYKKVACVHNKVYKNHNQSNDSYQTKSPNLEFKSGNKHINFINDKKISDMVYKKHYGTVQNITMSPDNQYLFVEYHEISSNDNSMLGKIAKFDLKTKKLIKESPEMEFGHGQSLSYNRHEKVLYLIVLGRNASKHAKIMRINPNDLKVLSLTDVKSKSYLISDQLAFDKHNNAYSYTKSENGTDGKNCLRIYKGKVNKKHSKLNLKQVIKHAPGFNNYPANIPQSMAYSQRNGRIYFVANGEIMSVPSYKLGHLKRKDIQDTVFNTNKEFEGLTFDSKGYAYLATRYQIFRSTRPL
ncbi:hypothetical protein [Apilactobacillus ozensis]|uniref:hypothetical protein n=1 Tax=Apilactobacillus ozensis TaxID=866801 RepID=UPI00200A37D6|nr:hypothetical protein [Apilactobacillus ozensis]MCK8607701.1 hypothetical protein [Apilactobacillus ozensis]